MPLLPLFSGFVFNAIPILVIRVLSNPVHILKIILELLEYYFITAGLLHKVGRVAPPAPPHHHLTAVSTERAGGWNNKGDYRDQYLIHRRPVFSLTLGRWSES